VSEKKTRVWQELRVTVFFFSLSSFFIAPRPLARPTHHRTPPDDRPSLISAYPSSSSDGVCLG
jgi:hypothetical protein